jgi:hypothetical protein
MSYGPQRLFASCGNVLRTSRRGSGSWTKLPSPTSGGSFIAWTEPGGRVQDHELLKVFQDWNPDIEVTLNLFTRAVNAVTGIGKTSSNSKQYWVGFHLPTADELAIRKKMAA